MQLHDKFLLEPIGEAPNSHLIFSEPIFIGTPYLIIGPSIMFSTTPYNDVLDIDDFTGAIETTVEELLKNKAHKRTHPVASPSLHYYPIPEEKYRTNKFEKIKQIVNTLPRATPRDKIPTIEVSHHELPEGVELLPRELYITETVHGIPTIIKITIIKNHTTATLIPPDLGMSTPLFFYTALNKFKHEITRELVQMYLDGLEIPTTPKLQFSKEKWEGKRVMVGTLYATVKKLLIHSHPDLYFSGENEIEIYLYSI